MIRASLVLAIYAVALVCTAPWIQTQQQRGGAPPVVGAKPAKADASAAVAQQPALAPPAPARTATQDRIDGEKRFRANCSRCHQTPHKFSPRATATIIRHMRVRATLTDEDARLILKYMSQ